MVFHQLLVTRWIRLKRKNRRKRRCLNLTELEIFDPSNLSEIFNHVQNHVVFMNQRNLELDGQEGTNFS